VRYLVNVLNEVRDWQSSKYSMQPGLWQLLWQLLHAPKHSYVGTSMYGSACV
jgi:hypothetical protein